MKRFTQICERSMSYENAIKSLHKSELFMKIKIFIDDLMNFGNDENARKRLEKGDLFYMSDLHFTWKKEKYWSFLLQMDVYFLNIWNLF